MNSTHCLHFSAFDNPTQLSKVGNWVITFLDTAEKAPIQLAITHVIPRQISNDLQLRTLHIQQTPQELTWQLIKVEYFDSTHDQMNEADLNSTLTENFIQQLIDDFARYDVEVHYA